MEQKIDQTSATDAVYDARTLGLPKMGLLACSTSSPCSAPRCSCRS